MNLIHLAVDILLAPYAMSHADLPPAPKPEPEPDAMTVLCAWCKKILREGSPTVTHGICDSCRALYFPRNEEPHAL
jgi:hypothetical protein